MLARIRLAGAVLGLVAAALAWAYGPFGTYGNAALAALVFLAAPAALERAFAGRISDAERRADLRDRVDNPPG